MVLMLQVRACMVTCLLLATLLLNISSCADGAAAAKPQKGGGVPAMIKASLTQGPVMLLTYPIDTIKTRLQIPFGAPSAYQRSAAAFSVRKINALQPPFWPGVVASCANQFPTFAIVFSVFEAARGILEERFPKQSKQTIDTAAVLAGRSFLLQKRRGVQVIVARTTPRVAGSLWSTPCEVVKCTFQSGMYTKSLRGAIRAINTETGALGFYQGYSAQLIRDLPLYGVMLGCYEALRDTYISKFLKVKDSKGRQTSKRRITSAENAAVGFFAGAVAGAMTNPFDVVRTQATMRTWGGRPWWSASNSASMMPRIFAEQGWRGLLAGCPERSLYVGIGAAAFFCAYEKFLVEGGVSKTKSKGVANTNVNKKR